MRVGVCHHGQLPFSAYRPKLGKGAAMQHANAAIIGMRIEVVVENSLADLKLFAALGAE
jgi:hypothetical protein